MAGVLYVIWVSSRCDATHNCNLAGAVFLHAGEAAIIAARITTGKKIGSKKSGGPEEILNTAGKKNGPACAGPPLPFD